MSALADLLAEEGFEPPPVSVELLVFELQMLAEVTVAEIDAGCRLCFRAGSEGDPIGYIDHCDDKAKTIAPVALCEACKIAITPAAFKRLARDLRPHEFVRADAIDAYGGMLLGDPSAPLKLKSLEASSWLSQSGN